MCIGGFNSKPEVNVAAAESTVSVSRAEMRAFTTRCNSKGVIRLVLLACLIASTSCAIYYSAESYFFIPAMFLHGVVLAHLFSLQHECEHHTAFRSKWICGVLSWVCGFFILVAPRYFHHEHNAHHRNTNIPGRDPELIDLPKSFTSYIVYISSVGYWYGLSASLIRTALGRFSTTELSFIPETERPKVIRESRLFLAGYLLIAIASAIHTTDAALWYWIVPLLLGQPVMRAIRMTEHVGRPQIKDRGKNTRSTIVSAAMHFLCWNMNYHAEHHFAPAVPFHALPALHERLKGSLFFESGGYIGAHRDIVRMISARTG